MLGYVYLACAGLLGLGCRFLEGLIDFLVRHGWSDPGPRPQPNAGPVAFVADEPLAVTIFFYEAAGVPLDDEMVTTLNDIRSLPEA